MVWYSIAKIKTHVPSTGEHQFVKTGALVYTKSYFSVFGTPVILKCALVGGLARRAVFLSKNIRMYTYMYRRQQGYSQMTLLWHKAA